MPAKSNTDVALQLKEKVANENKRDRQGDNRSRLYFVKAEYDATKLDEIFGPDNWDLEILDQGSKVWEQKLINYNRESRQREEYQARVASAWVTARLTVTFPDGKKVSRDGIGAGDAIRRLDNPNSVETEGLALKSAATDALKRAATLLGNIFGRGMEKDGSQSYDYDYVPPEDDDADPESRPTAPVEIAPVSQIQQPETPLPSQPQASASAQRQAPTQQARESTITSGLPRQTANDGPTLAPRQVRPDSHEHRPLTDDFEAAIGHPAKPTQPADDPLSQHLRLIIPQGSLLDIGVPAKWRDIFVKLNEARKNFVTTADHVATFAEHMADFRKRATAENIITGGSAGARDIKVYFDTMDTFVERKRKEILGISQAA